MALGDFEVSSVIAFAFVLVGKTYEEEDSLMVFGYFDSFLQKVFVQLIVVDVIAGCKLVFLAVEVHSVEEVDEFVRVDSRGA